MKQETRVSVLGKIRKFFAQLSDKIDKKMEAEAKSGSCCGKSGQGKNKSCCS